jgi:hypothetical protein
MDLQDGTDFWKYNAMHHDGNGKKRMYGIIFWLPS